MILNRNLYEQVSFLRAIWRRFQMRKFAGEGEQTMFSLSKVTLAGQSYFYSPRLRRRPKFSGNQQLLSTWDAKVLETICPTNAIKVVPKDILIDPRGCTSCGLCVEVSPTGLLEVSLPVAIS